MLPTWLIKKIDKSKIKNDFIQEQLTIEEFVPTLKEIESVDKKEEVEQRGVIIIDIF